MNPHAAPFVRFWWLALIGLVVAGIAGTAVVFHIEPGIPPKLTERTPPTYTATTTLLLNSKEHPLVRTGVTTVTPREPAPSGDARPPDVKTEPPDVDSLIEAANLLPLAIQSDAVADLRRERVGDRPGTVTAQALFAGQTPGGGVKPSDFPAIEVNAESPTPAAALVLARGTISAFGEWLVAEQDEAKVPQGQRIFFVQLNAPTVSENTKNAYGLALLVAAAVLAGFALLVVALDRLFPRKQRRRSRLFRRRKAEEHDTSSESIGSVEDGDVAPGAGDGRESPMPVASGNGPAQASGRLQAWLDEATPSGSEAEKSSERAGPG